VSYKQTAIHEPSSVVISIGFLEYFIAPGSKKYFNGSIIFIKIILHQKLLYHHLIHCCLKIISGIVTNTLVPFSDVIFIFPFNISVKSLNHDSPSPVPPETEFIV